MVIDTDMITATIQLKSEKIIFLLFDKYSFFTGNTKEMLCPLMESWKGSIFTHKHRDNKMNCELMLTYDTPALRQTGSRNLMGYLYEACDQISNLCHQ